MIYEGKTIINFYDIDGRGDVSLTALLKHINLSAGANATEIGVGLKDTLPLGLTFVIQRFALRTFNWPTFRQEVLIRTWPADIARGTFRRNGDMWDKDGKKMAEWTGLWVLIDVVERKVKRPKALNAELPSYGFMDVAIESPKIEVPTEVELVASYPHIVQFSELDINQHMNNAIYGDLIANVLEIGGYVPKYKEVQFNYLTEAKLGEEIEVKCMKNANKQGRVMYITGTAKTRNIFAACVEI